MKKKLLAALEVIVIVLIAFLIGYCVYVGKLI